MTGHVRELGAVIGQERFRGGWPQPGDVGTITPDGFLTLVDRSKDMIKSGGEWIASAGLDWGHGLRCVPFGCRLVRPGPLGCVA